MELEEKEKLRYLFRGWAFTIFGFIACCPLFRRLGFGFGILSNWLGGNSTRAPGRVNSSVIVSSSSSFSGRHGGSWNSRDTLGRHLNPWLLKGVLNSHWLDKSPLVPARCRNYIEFARLFSIHEFHNTFFFFFLKKKHLQQNAVDYRRVWGAAYQW